MVPVGLSTIYLQPQAFLSGGQLRALLRRLIRLYPDLQLLLQPANPVEAEESVDGPNRATNFLCDISHGPPFIDVHRLQADTGEELNEAGSARPQLDAHFVKAMPGRGLPYAESVGDLLHIESGLVEALRLRAKFNGSRFTDGTASA